jgi:hypothetical protein
MTLGELSGWCAIALGVAIDAVLFEAGFSSHVYGVRLRDGRDVVLKIRDYAPRLAGTAAVHEHLWRAGFPCPQPLTGPLLLGDRCVSAEGLVTGGCILEGDPQAPELYAQAFAELVRRAPSPTQVPPLQPPPSWLHWDHSEKGLWPRADRLGLDLNTLPCKPWLIDVAKRVRARLARCTQPPVVGHADWWSENLRWQGRQLHVVFDWDSIVAQPEPILVGAAAYMFAATTFEIEGSATGASVAESERFLREYERARGLTWSRDDWEVAWAAGLWVAAYRAQLSQTESITGTFAELVRRDAGERLRRAGA